LVIGACANNRAACGGSECADVPRRDVATATGLSHP